MSKRNYNFIFALAFLFIQGGIFAQTNTPATDSINNSLEELFNSSNNFKQYKVVKASSFQNLRRDIKNQVSNLETDMEKLHQKIKKQESQIGELQKDLKESNAGLKTAIQDKDKLSILGIDTQKSSYNTIVSIIILGLALGLIVFIYKFKRSNKITVEARHLLKENEQEFDSYRKKALETQQKLGRQIINERNKMSRNSVEI